MLPIEVMGIAALRAGEFLLERQPVARSLETSKDFVTDTDLMSERIIFGVLGAQFPDIPILSEEAGGEILRSGRLWVIDPIDGTINYYFQDDHWGISIALVEDGQTIAAIVYLPAKDLLLSATNEQTTQMRRPGRREPWTEVRVNSQSAMKECQIWQDWGKELHDGDDHRRVITTLDRLNQRTLYPQMRNGCIASASMVALGRIAGYVFTNPEPFDVAAVGLCIKQAGGTVTDLQGNPWDPFCGSIIASNGRIHRQLLDVVNL